MNDGQELLGELLDRLARGETEAAAQVFVTYAPYLRKVIRRQLPAQLRPKLDSSDVLQSAWRDVLEGLRDSNWKFENPAQLQAFLVRVMRNRCIDRYRQFRQPMEREKQLADVPSDSLPPCSRPDPGAVAQANELWDRMLELCPPEHREVLRLKREGASAADIAARTGLHEGSIRRLLRQLASRLAAESAPPPSPDSETAGD
jgi:RNA polymerase sigma-70 factor (ECF subfamily)